MLKSCLFYFQFTTKVLYIHPLTKVIALTQLAHLVSPDPSSPITLAPLEVGQVIKNARITRVEPRRAVYMDIGSEKRCIAYVSIAEFKYNFF